MKRRNFLGGLGAVLAAPGVALAEPCGEEERRKLLRFGDWIVPEAQACGSGGGPGPPASSAFLTVDFTSAFNYPGGTGQQVVSPRMWGTSGGGMGDANFQIWSNATYTSLMATVNPGLFMLKNSGQQYWNSNLSVNPSIVANLVNNFYKADPLGVSGVIIGTDFNQSAFTTTPALWGQAMANLASYLVNFTMPNGKKFPLIGMMGMDEPDCAGVPESTVAQYYTALGQLLPAGVSLVGPNTCFENGAWLDFPTQVSSLGVYSWDTYVQNYTGPISGGSPTDLTGFTAQPTRFQGDASRASAGLTRKPTAMMLGGYNIDSACTAAPMNSSIGAIFAGWAMINTLNNAYQQMWACIWDGFSDGTCGMVTGSAPPDDQSGAGFYGVGSTLLITPKAYLTGQGVRKVVGPRWSVTSNSAGLLVCATTPSAGHCSVMVVNQGHGAQNGQLVAMSHWPVNTSGSGTANVWQMTSSGPLLPGTDGTSTTINVVNGVTTTSANWPSGLNFPDPSITIISV